MNRSIIAQTVMWCLALAACSGAPDMGAKANLIQDDGATGAAGQTATPDAGRDTDPDTKPAPEAGAPIDATGDATNRDAGTEAAALDAQPEAAPEPECSQASDCDVPANATAACSAGLCTYQCDAAGAFLTRGYHPLSTWGYACAYSQTWEACPYNGNLQRDGCPTCATGQTPCCSHVGIDNPTDNFCGCWDGRECVW